MKRNSVAKKNVKKLPNAPGVYFLLDDKKEVFYIGKSTNIQKRVQDHMKGKFAKETKHISWIETSGEIEALLEEARYIKQYRPKLNVLLKDDKQYFYVGILQSKKESLPYITITHRPIQRLEYIGPFTEGRSLKLLLKYLRKIFPYYTTAKHTKLPCGYCHLDLCPGPEPDAQEYKKNIRRIKRILEGKHKTVESELQKEMKKAAKSLEFEHAQKIRNILLALKRVFEHKDFLTGDIIDVPTLHSLIGAKNPISTIEGYDISNIQGKESVASMVRFENGKPDKSLYRKFRIRLPEKPNDTAMIREVVTRRLSHPEWPYPDLFLIDGGKGQLNAALGALREADRAKRSFGQAVGGSRKAGHGASEVRRDLRSKNTPMIISLAKRQNEIFVPGRKKSIKLDTEAPNSIRNLLMYIRDESHRFAITYHRKLHRKTFR